MIAVAPHSPSIPDSPETPLRDGAEVLDKAPISSGRDIPALHDEVKQHPEISRFTEITDLKSLEGLSGASDIANFYKIGTAKPHAQLFKCRNDNHLVVILKGPEAAEHLFKGGAYTVFGMGRFFGGFAKNIAKQWLGGATNLVSHEGQKLQYSQVRDELKSGELKAVAIYEQCPKSGQYSKRPKAIALLDKASQMIKDIEEGIPEGDEKAGHLAEILERAKHDGHLQKLYQCNLLITDPKEREDALKEKNLIKAATMVAEVCPKEWQILFPMKLFKDGMEDQSLAKDYQTLNWEHPIKKDGEWTHQSGQVTLARAKENAHEPISELLAFIHNWHVLHEADASVHLSQEDDEQFLEAYNGNKVHIREYNQAQNDTVAD